jgi:chain length determinant protein EpsF
MTITQFLMVLRARWRLALLIWLGTFALVVGVSLMLEPQYVSTAAVVVDSKGSDPLGGGSGNGSVLPGYMATQVDVAQSERVLVQAIHALHLNDSPKIKAQWQAATGGRGNLESWLAKQLLKKYTVRPSRDSNAITLSYADPDPRASVDITNALVQAYIDTTLELRVEPAKQYNTFFDDRARQMRDALEQAQTKLSVYQRKNGLLATEERFDVESTRLIELSSQVVAMQTAAAESRGRESEAVNNPERMSEVLNNSVVTSLTTDLSREEVRLKELKSRLGDMHPQVVEAESNVAEVRRRIAAAVHKSAGSVTVNNNVTRARLEEARSELEQQRAKVLELKAKRDEAAVLQRDVENAQRAYDAVLARVSQTDLESQNRQANVSILQRATLPPFPSSPNVLMNAAVGFVLGLLLAVATALIREMTDRRLRTEMDVTHAMGLPMLTILPRTLPSGRGNDPRLAQMKARVLNGLPRPVAS